MKFPKDSVNVVEEFAYKILLLHFKNFEYSLC